jgi:RNA polymerase sigma-70 factor (ECF subfamily)
MTSTDAEADEEWRLVESVQNGDLGAFDGLVRRHMRRGFSIAYRMLGQREDAEDLVQDAFLAALQGIQTFQPGRPFGPWFYRIVVNRGNNARRARALRETETIPEAASARLPSPEQSAERADLRRRLAKAMASLPERERIVVLLFELEGFTSAEIAEILQVPAGTVRWSLHRARKILRASLAPLAKEERQHDR